MGCIFMCCVADRFARGIIFVVPWSNALRVACPARMRSGRPRRTSLARCVMLRALQRDACECFLISLPCGCRTVFLVRIRHVEVYRDASRDMHHQSPRTRPPPSRPTCRRVQNGARKQHCGKDTRHNRGGDMARGGCGRRAGQRLRSQGRAHDGVVRSIREIFLRERPRHRVPLPSGRFCRYVSHAFRPASAAQSRTATQLPTPFPWCLPLC